MSFNLLYHRGDFEFIEWVLKKYIDYLPYKGSVRHFAIEVGFKKDVSYLWKSLKGRIPPKVINYLHKDLLILKARGENVLGIEELRVEFDSLDFSKETLDKTKKFMDKRLKELA